MLLSVLLGLVSLIPLKNIVAEHKKHVEALTVPNSEIKDIQLSLMSKPVTLYEDPMINEYNRDYRGTALDIENDENTMKAIKNINTPLLIRVPANFSVYQDLLLHN